VKADFPDLNGYTLNDIHSNGMNFMSLRFARATHGGVAELFLCLAFHRIESCDIACEPLFKPLHCRLSEHADGSRYTLEASNDNDLLVISFKDWSFIESTVN
jgi:hypothetical protein